MNAVDLDMVLPVSLPAALRLYDAAGYGLALLDPTGHDLACGALAGPATLEKLRIVAR